MKKGILLPLYYFPPISSFVLAYHFDSIKFYVPKKFQKQSYYQRCYIKCNEVEKLIIPLKKEGHLTPFDKLIVDDSKHWRKKHLKAIEQCYSVSAFFFHYFPEIEKILLNKSITKLVELNTRIYKMLLDELELIRKLNEEAEKWYFPKLPLKKREKLPWLKLEKYYQLFGEFEEDLSIIDLIMHYGMESRLILKQSFDREKFFNNHIPVS